MEASTRAPWVMSHVRVTMPGGRSILTMFSVGITSLASTLPSYVCSEWRVGGGRVVNVCGRDGVRGCGGHCACGRQRGGVHLPVGRGVSCYLLSLFF